MLTDNVGPVQIEVPRDRDASFDPVIVRKRQRRLDPKGTGQQRWTMRWKPALNAFAITFGDRTPKAEQH